jgi:hypothetical protein
MPAAAVAVNGHARAVSSWLNLVERLGFGADDQLAAAGSSGAGAVLGRADRDPPKRRWPPARSPSEDIGQCQPAAEVSALGSEGAVGALR